MLRSSIQIPFRTGKLFLLPSPQIQTILQIPCQMRRVQGVTKVKSRPLAVNRARNQTHEIAPIRANEVAHVGDPALGSAPDPENYPDPAPVNDLGPALGENTPVLAHKNAHRRLAGAGTTLRRANRRVATGREVNGPDQRVVDDRAHDLDEEDLARRERRCANPRQSQRMVIHHRL